jgi:lipoyl(octanoyl) transferase
MVLCLPRLLAENRFPLFRKAPYQYRMTEPIDWTVTPGLTSYPAAVAAMEARVSAIAEGRAPEQVWLLEHEPLYTAGTSARVQDLILPDRLPVYRTGRGGQYTYHGPGQRVVYVMMDLNRRGRDVHHFVSDLEQVVIDALADFGIEGGRREGRVGVWVLRKDGREEKIAAIGVRLRHWISFHGLALNVRPDLADYEGIVPCGLADYGVTSLQALGVDAGMNEVDARLRGAFESRFGAIAADPSPPIASADLRSE